jgi:DNA-binding NarL/FixJ family response regulator
MIRVLLADDHPIFRKGVSHLIAASDGMEVVAEVNDGLAALRVAEEVQWDVALLDISMPQLNGIEVLRRLARSFPQRKILMLSQFPEDQFAARVVNEGGAGYIPKSGPPERLIDAIRLVAVGRPLPLTSPVATTRPAPAGHSSVPHDALTAREHQVFLLVARGRGVTEVAAELNVASSTVSNHLANIKEKLGVGTVGAIVAYAHRVGLVE